MLETAISTMGVNLIRLRGAVRDSHKKKDVSNAKTLFVQMTSLMKQIDRYTKLHHICASMLDRVKEQAVMATTSNVMQQFVSVHHDLIKDCNLDKLVSQYQDLQDNVDGIRSGFDSVVNAGLPMDIADTDWDAELLSFIDEEDALDNPTAFVPPPAPVRVAAPTVPELAAPVPAALRPSSTPVRIATDGKPPDDRPPDEAPPPPIAELWEAPTHDPFPAVPSTIIPLPATRDLRELFGSAVVKNDKTAVIE